MGYKHARRRALIGLPFLILAATIPITSEAAPITYTDIAQNSGSGLVWRRAPSATQAAWDAVKIKPYYQLKEQNETPLKWRGDPGVALIDYDKDGDLDIYVTNGPGRPNSLFQNQLAQTGQVTFVDVGAAAGVGAADQDSTGVCYGDIDNDGDQDLMVLGRMESNRLFRNEGNGQFTEITSTANVSGGIYGHTSCSMGDINGDGLLDIAVSNTFDWVRQDAIFTDYFAFNHKNQLFINKGNNRFEDVSPRIQKLDNVPPGDATISWAVAMVDYDQDGDVDIIHNDDQAGLRPAQFAGINRGLQQLHKNDGKGNFTVSTLASGLTDQGAWMGIAFGDLNSDGYMDMFGTNAGGWLVNQLGVPIPPDFTNSRWHLGGPGGTFTLPGVGALKATPFGWGCGMADYDNDGDTDIIYYGNLDDGPLITADNPGTILSNDGLANFTWDRNATLANAERVMRQDTHGVALGDLNGDGFVDIVHASGSYSPNIPLVRNNQSWGSPFDVVAYHMPLMYPIGPFEYEWAGVDSQEGLLGVELSSGNENKWVKVGVLGTVQLTSDGRVNRDGIGAVVKFLPEGGRPVMSPVLGGSSHTSQHSMVQGFGLGDKAKGMVEILWPTGNGGTKNRLYDVMAGETVTVPEIPCDYSKKWPGKKNQYSSCVNRALNQLYLRGVIDSTMSNRLRASASRAYDESH